MRQLKCCLEVFDSIYDSGVTKYIQLLDSLLLIVVVN